jgi:hypothetical protein
MRRKRLGTRRVRGEGVRGVWTRCDDGDYVRMSEILEVNFFEGSETEVETGGQEGGRKKEHMSRRGVPDGYLFASVESAKESLSKKERN